MEIKVPVIVKDPEVSEYKGISPTEEVAIEEETFLDGPVSPRVAVLDFDPATGALEQGVRFVPPAEGESTGRYDVARPVQPGGQQVAREAAAVSVFGAVHKTMRMFEEPDAIGRKVAWAFGAPQILVVPRSGEWANAYYERESHSLQFFHFRADNGQRIHTCHSQDIVAHETAHAVLDGVAPDLYNAISPQSLAIHEAVADLAALLCAFRCRELAQRVLEQTRGSIAHSSAFSGLAEQFAGGLQRNRPYLRDLNNDRSLSNVDRSDPHPLSEVLSGALYRVLVAMHEELWQQYQAKEQADAALIAVPEAEYVQQQVRHVVPDASRDRIAAATKALFVASERLKRTLFRGLDYLPPGDVTFADLARAILASDQASHPESDRQREWLKQEFVDREIVPSKRALAVKTNFTHPALKDVDLDALLASDYLAYDFANRNRDLLGIPADVTFEVRPRLKVTKLYWHRDRQEEVSECLFKVAWTQLERNGVGNGLPRKRRFSAGTTLAIAWSEQPLVRAVLTASRAERERRDTDKLLTSLLMAEQLRPVADASEAEDLPFRGVIPAEVYSGALRVRGAGRLLHVTRGY